MNPSSQTHTPPRPGIGYRLMQGMTWPMMKMLGLSCRSYAELCSTRLDRSLTFSERLRFRFHGLMCHLCRPLPRQFEHLRALTRCVACEDPAHSHDASAPTEVLGEDAVQRIRHALEQNRFVDPE